eukprot:PITA_16616
MRRLLSVELVDILFLQETLSQGCVITHLLESWLPRWTFHTLDASGRSGGFVLGVKNRSIRICNVWGSSGHLGAHIYSSELDIELRIIKIYGPCHNREEFWNRILDSHILQKDKLVLGGDLNFSISFAESWGHNAQRDILSDIFESNLEDHNLIDIPSPKILPTWRNNRSGADSISRRLDIYLIKEHMLTLGRGYRQWVGSGGISNHRPIYLEIKGGLIPQWQKGLYRKDLQKNLKEIKSLSKKWAHKKRTQEDHTLKQTKEAIEKYENDHEGIFSSLEHKEQITSLLAKRTHILKDREERWRLRSRAIWIKEGDDNTKFYHKFANGRKSINTIW